MQRDRVMEHTYLTNFMAATLKVIKAFYDNQNSAGNQDYAISIRMSRYLIADVAMTTCETFSTMRIWQHLTDDAGY